MRLDERGKQCPLPVIEAKRALEASKAGEIVEVVVDNEIAVQNLRKLADHRGLKSKYEKVSDREFLVEIEAGAAAGAVGNAAGQGGTASAGPETAGPETADPEAAGPETAGPEAADPEAAGPETAGPETADPETAARPEDISCQPDSRRKGMVVVLSSNQMGQGDEALGTLLMKGFVYALTQQDVLPGTVLLYNGGAKLSCEGSDSLEDLKALEAQGTEVLTCGTCLNHYGLGDQLAVGGVTNMYEIAERMTGAALLVRP